MGLFALSRTRHDKAGLRQIGRSAAPLLRCGDDKCPKYLVFRARHVDRRNTHAVSALEQHVGAVRRRIAPARERLGQCVVAGRDVLGRHLGVVTRAFQPLNERGATGVVGDFDRAPPLPGCVPRRAASVQDRATPRRDHCWRGSRRSSRPQRWRQALRPHSPGCDRRSAAPAWWFPRSRQAPPQQQRDQGQRKIWQAFLPSPTTRGGLCTANNG